MIVKKELLKNKKWIKTRWYDFRQGHAIYLAFIMTFANFITIQYALLIAKAPILSSIFSNILIFAVVFIMIYFPLSMIIGYWHRKNQLSVEQEAIFNNNIVGATLWLFLFEYLEGKLTEQEKAQMKERLMKITAGKKTI